MRNGIISLGLFLLVIALSGCITTEHQDFHVHADFAVYVEGQRMDFNYGAFMSDSNTQLDGFVHLHDFNPHVIHYHAQNIPLKRFFNSLNMKWQEDCFNLGEQTPICDSNTTGKTWKLYVNGKLNTENENYVANDLDRLLITYGNNSPQELHDQLESITDVACIQSGKCPERGTPYGETCTTGGGCSVDLNNLNSVTCITLPLLGKNCF